MTNPLGQANPGAYEQQFDEKVMQLQEEFSQFDLPKLRSFRSPPSNFRMRAEFKIWHENSAVNYAMYTPGEYKKPTKINDFSIGSRRMCELMPILLAEINQSHQLKHKLFQVEFLTSTQGEALISLIYHRRLDIDWESEARMLESTLECNIIGRSRKQKIVLSKDYIIQSFAINDKSFSYQQVETGFTQPNAVICENMLTWAQDVSRICHGDLLELYCGNGNFTLPLAQNFRKVLATEVAKTSVNSALFNIKLNKVENINVLRMSSEEFCAAINKEREFNRLQNIQLDDYDFSTIFVDPPRAGLDSATEKLVAKFDNILYISCNPETLKANLSRLTLSHDISDFAFFDQFPYSHHKECGVMLKRKSDGVTHKPLT